MNVGSGERTLVRLLFGARRDTFTIPPVRFGVRRLRCCVAVQQLQLPARVRLPHARAHNEHLVLSVVICSECFLLKYIHIRLVTLATLPLTSVLTSDETFSYPYNDRICYYQ